MKTTVTIVRIHDEDTHDVWVDCTTDDGREVDVIEALGIVELAKTLLVAQA